MFSLKDRKWDLEIVKKCGLKEGIYPVVYESGTAIGKVRKNVADETGLSKECIVVSGGGDAQLGCVGIGVVKQEQAALFGGSFWQLEYNVDKPVVDREFRIRVNCHAVPGIWQYELLAFFPGLIMRWFRDSFCQLEKLVEAETGIDAYYLMDKAASKVPPGSNGLMCTFSDVMNYISWKHAAPSFINFAINVENFDRKVFYRAIMENAALVTLGHAKIIESVTGKYPKDIIFASGASKSSLWCSIVADVLNTQIRVPKVKEAAALGTAICAGVGAGIFGSIAETAGKFCVIEKTYEPNPENSKIYQEIYDKWREVYKTQMDIADKGLTNYMWKAPGI
jgi:autoinducer 2 (AI-2) kinase